MLNNKNLQKNLCTKGVQPTRNLGTLYTITELCYFNLMNKKQKKTNLNDRVRKIFLTISKNA